MRVMLVTSDPSLERTVHRLLGDLEYEVVLGDAGSEELAGALSRGAPRMVLWDAVSAEAEAISFCRALREADGGRYTYVLLLVSPERREQVVELLESGADDFAVLPLEPKELAARLLSGRRILALRERLHTTRAALREQALRDGLTGLWNRRAIMDFLEGELARSERSGESVAVALLAVDHLPQLIREQGGTVGDAVLRALSRRLKTSLRASDGVGRYGDGLFLAVLGGCGEERAQSIAARVLRSITARPVEVEGVAYDLSGRAGWAAASGATDTADDLVRRALDAMEQA